MACKSFLLFCLVFLFSLNRWPHSYVEGKIEGVVLDSEGNPLPKVSITIVSSKMASRKFEIMSKKDGKFVPMPDGNKLVTSESKLLVIGTQKGINITKGIVQKRQKPEELKYV